MRDQIIRIILMCVLIIFVTSDIHDMMSSPHLSFVGSWFGRLHPKISNRDKRTARDNDQMSSESSTAALGSKEWIQNQIKDNPELQMELATLEKQKEQMMALKSKWTQVMQDFCLPKLVCELHATVSDGFSMSDAERGLLSLIKDTSLGSAGEIVSRYHFAAHFGQLLSGVEGNGCHNFYPNCPISGTRILQMVRRVKV